LKDRKSVMKEQHLDLIQNNIIEEQRLSKKLGIEEIDKKFS